MSSAEKRAWSISVDYTRATICCTSVKSSASAGLLLDALHVVAHDPLQRDRFGMRRAAGRRATRPQRSSKRFSRARAVEGDDETVSDPLIARIAVSDHVG